MTRVLVLLAMIAGCDDDCATHIEAELSCAGFPLDGVRDVASAWASLADDCDEEPEHVAPIANCARSSATCREYLECVHVYYRDTVNASSSPQPSARSRESP